MMFPTPKGYIDIPDAVDRVSRALHGEPKTIPWRGKDLDEAVKHLDEAVLRSGREQTTEAQEWLIAELSAGRLVVEIDNIEVPAEYWTCYGAHTTAHTGCLQPPEISAWDYAKLAYQPCFIERSAFEERLFQQFDTAPPKGKGGNRRTYATEAIAEPSAARPNRRGRKKGVGGYDSKDMPLIEKMDQLIKSGKATSPSNAALMVVDDAPGTRNVANRAKRLVGKYAAKYSPGEGLSD